MGEVAALQRHLCKRSPAVRAHHLAQRGTAGQSLQPLHQACHGVEQVALRRHALGDEFDIDAGHAQAVGGLDQGDLARGPGVDHSDGHRAEVLRAALNPRAARRLRPQPQAGVGHRRAAVVGHAQAGGVALHRVHTCAHRVVGDGGSAPQAAAVVLRQQAQTPFAVAHQHVQHLPGAVRQAAQAQGECAHVGFHQRRPATSAVQRGRPGEAQQIALLLVLHLLQPHHARRVARQCQRPHAPGHRRARHRGHGGSARRRHHRGLDHALVAPVGVEVNPGVPVVHGERPEAFAGAPALERTVERGQCHALAGHAVLRGPHQVELAASFVFMNSTQRIALAPRAAGVGGCAAGHAQLGGALSIHRQGFNIVLHRLAGVVKALPQQPGCAVGPTAQQQARAVAARGLAPRHALGPQAVAGLGGGLGKAALPFGRVAAGGQ